MGEAHRVFRSDRSQERLGQPFLVAKHGTRQQVVAAYRDYLLCTPSLLNRLDELRGRVLGCWCYPEPCHGDVLAEMINRGA